ncbi:MAG: hypothetical protein O4861_14130 [Trichodesmium sp. St16_bin4-tuft]|nr:hypothetical protein [Trichodesmium sp. St5_bin8]MDE5078886.1 hypothetical protein [Trichodesmium sp. St2_bin6]MDE5099403.1 hypothetical protein [Trichodesmium sp. St16_bin4-tuft]MDE5104076.1 hypothetical protein [Trichodesmium sp. St19_bin2]
MYQYILSTSIFISPVLVGLNTTLETTSHFTHIPQLKSEGQNPIQLIAHALEQEEVTPGKSRDNRE